MDANAQMMAMMNQMMMGGGGAAAQQQPQQQAQQQHTQMQQQLMQQMQQQQAQQPQQQQQQSWGGGGGGGGKGKSNENATCSVHGKNRSVRNLMDDGAGGMCCSAGFECQTGSPGGGGKVEGKGAGWSQKKSRLCTYFEAGNCPRGGACSFAHGQHEMGTYADASAAPKGGGKGDFGGKGGGEKGGFSQGDWNCPACGDHQFARNTECRKCGAPNPNGGGVSFGGGGGGGAWQDPAAAAGEPTMTCTAHGIERGVMCLTNDGAGGIRCKEGDECQPHMMNKGGGGGGKGAGKAPAGKGGKDGWQKKVRLCTYFEAGSCTKPFCSFAHGEAEIGTWVSLDGQQTAPAKGGGKGKGDKGAGGGGMMPGDWACPGCGDHQFARNTECRKCGTPNPTGGTVRPAPY